MKQKAIIRTKTLTNLKQFYEEALNPRYCINGVYHIKLSNWFPNTGNSIGIAVNNTLNALFERIAPVEYKIKYRNLTFSDFIVEYEKHHLVLAEKRFKEREEKKLAEKQLTPEKELTQDELIEQEIAKEEVAEIYEEIKEAEPVTMFNLIEQNSTYLKRLVELQEENRIVQKHLIENSMAYNLKVVQKLASIDKLLQDYLK